MAMNDPWDWTNNQQQMQVIAPLASNIAPLAASNERGDPNQVVTMQPTQAELQAQRDTQQLHSMAVNKGAEKGSQYLYDKYKQLDTPPLSAPAPVEMVPVVEQSVLASYPTTATSAGSLAGVGAQTIAPMAVEASAAPLAAAGTEAGLATTLASNPIGWGIGALMLAKSMKWI